MLTLRGSLAALFSRGDRGPADLRRSGSSGPEGEDHLRAAQEAPPSDQEAHPPFAGGHGEVVQRVLQ